MQTQRRINVVDMYHGNNITNPDFAALKEAGIYAVVHKASQGSFYEDPAYSARKVAATAAGLLWGAYHFLDASDPIKQAQHFLDASEITDAGADPFLLAADFENSASQPTLKQLMQFMQEVDRNSPPNVQCALYSGNLIRETLKGVPPGHVDQDMLGARAFFQQRRLWLAEYGPKEQVPYPWCEPVAKSSNEAATIPAPGVFMWQFTETGRVNPLTGNVDGNFFDGTFEQLSERWLR